MNQQNSKTPVIMQVAEAMGDRNILRHRFLRSDTKVQFVYGLSDNTTIVATRPIDKSFERMDEYDESFESVWKRLCNNIEQGDMQ